jgi:NAD(P)H-flavin reductase
MPVWPSAVRVGAMAEADKEFLLYPLDTGDDPACLSCGKTMVIAAVEERGDQPGFITFRCMCGRTEKFICEHGPASTNQI